MGLRNKLVKSLQAATPSAVGNNASRTFSGITLNWGPSDVLAMTRLGGRLWQLKPVSMLQGMEFVCMITASKPDDEDNVILLS